jgi:hypothetical protein
VGDVIRITKDVGDLIDVVGDDRLLQGEHVGFELSET